MSPRSLSGQTSLGLIRQSQLESEQFQTFLMVKENPSGKTTRHWSAVKESNPGVCLFCWFVCKFLCTLIAFLIALQWKCRNLLGEKQPQFTETSTPRKDRTRLLISLHIRRMWETICDAWACWSGWNFGPNSTVYPYSVEYPAPPPLPSTSPSPSPQWKLSESPSLSTEYPPPMKIVRS